MKKSKRLEEWGEMIPEELLMLVVDRLNLFRDYVAFRGVCRYWRKVARKELFANKSSHQPPQLMISLKEDDMENYRYRKVYCPMEEKVQRVLLPEVSCRKRCMETLGWLVMVDTITHDIELFHPFSRVRLPLPDKSTFFHHHVPPDKYYGIVHKAVLSASPSFTNNYELVVIYGVERHLAFWRPGSQTWYHLDQTTSSVLFMDVIFYRNQFHVVDFEGRIYVLDLDETAGIVRLLATPNPLLEDGTRYYLVGATNLLLVERSLHLPYKGSVEKYYYSEFQVYEVDMNDPQKILRRTKDLGSRTLFLGHNASSSVDIADQSSLQGIKPNRIYYTDDMTSLFLDCDYYGTPHPGPGDMGIYNLANRKRERHFYEPYSLNPSCPPIWFHPSF